jgi:hypothetical protein
MSGNARKRIVLLTNQTVDETTAQPIDLLGYTNLCLFYSGAGTTSSGVLTIEEADYDPNTQVPYGGTWSTITTLNASDVTGGVTKAYHFPAAAYSWVRVRISTAIGGGGSLSASLVAVP